MRLRWAHCIPLREQRRDAHLQLAEQVLSLVRQLTAGRNDGQIGPGRSQLAWVKTIAARQRLCVSAMQIGVDGAAGVGVQLEPQQLRVVFVAAGFAPQYGACQQALAPESRQALRIEIARVQRPEPHCLRAFIASPAWGHAWP